MLQHMEYLQFGETSGEECVSSCKSKYKFNVKELDEETGWYYYGARYYNPKWSIWLGVDPMAAEKYPDWCPCNSTLQNPIKYVDPDWNAPRQVNHCCDSPGALLSFGNYLADKIDSGLESMGEGISNTFGGTADFVMKGGVVGYVHGKLIRDGVVPNKVKSGNDVTYANLKGFAINSDIYSPEIKEVMKATTGF